ncbi:MAG: exosortase-associated EpsI family protein [Phycisphaerales bacterium]|nr:exosortase-associated EpsI family protein [Phycisphaerales bacterium]
MRHDSGDFRGREGAASAPGPSDVPSGSRASARIKSHRHFVAAVVLLLAVAAGVPLASRQLQLVLAKQPIELRIPLHQLDRSRLGPYVFRDQIVLDDNIVDALGTRQYIYWRLEDTSYPPESPDPRRFADLSVTYYTGQPDPVPHTPDTCLLGAGYTHNDVANLTMDVPALGEARRVPIRVLTSVKSDLRDREERTIVYTFHCNGRFACTREGVRLIVNNLTDRYAYYSKVEISFGSDQCRPKYPPREQTVEAAEKLLTQALPVLVDTHWPDWNEASGQRRKE